MTEFLLKAAYTFSMRWYVVVFFLFYLLVGIYTFGLRRLLVFTFIGYFIALACEASSIRNGFPFGLYHYAPDMIQKELSFFGVPVWDSLSFVFLTFFPYQFALLLFSPLVKVKWYDLQMADTWKIRHRPAVLITAVFLMTMIDTVVDPLTLQGKKWFLGYVYYYPNGGSHFGVPISNYLGLVFTGFCILGTFILVDKYLLIKKKTFNKMPAYLPSKALYGMIMYYGIILFNIVITYIIGMNELGISSVLIYVLPTVLVIGMFFKKSSYARQEDLLNHFKDFPESKLLNKIHE